MSSSPNKPQQPALPDEERLLAYAEGRLSPAEAQALEEELMESAAGADALEGLQGWNAGEASAAKASITRRLQSELARKSRRKRRPMADSRWYYAAVVLILLLAAVCWYLLKSMK